MPSREGFLLQIVAVPTQEHVFIFLGYQRCAQMAFRMGARDAVFCHTSQANRSRSIWPLLFLQREHVFGRALLEVNLGVFFVHFCTRIHMLSCTMVFGWLQIHNDSYTFVHIFVFCDAWVCRNDSNA